MRPCVIASVCEIATFLSSVILLFSILQQSRRNLFRQLPKSYAVEEYAVQTNSKNFIYQFYFYHNKKSNFTRTAIDRTTITARSRLSRTSISAHGVHIPMESDIGVGKKCQRRFMDTISRLPPPGGTQLLNVFRPILTSSYRTCQSFLEETSLTSVGIEIILHVDYESVVGSSLEAFRSFVLEELQRLLKNSSFHVDTVHVSRGSVKIFYDLKSDLKRNALETKTLTSLTNIFNVPNLSESFAVASSNHYVTKISPNPSSTVKSIPSAPPEKTQNFSTKNVSELNNNRKPRETLRQQRVSREAKDTSSANSNSDARLLVRFKLNKGAEDSSSPELQRHLIRQLARRMRVPLSSIQDFSVVSGTDVVFTLAATNDENNLMDSETVLDAHDLMRSRIKTNQLRLTDLKGHQLMTFSGAVADPEDEPVNFTVVILIVLSFVLLMMLLLVITLAMLYRRISNTRNVSSKSRKKAYHSTELGRESSQSDGRYSYDSGLWLGPGPEPLSGVPDASYYRPPTAEQIASTPRPHTAVRTRLKRNWSLTTIPDDFDRS